ncbi:hypothetical protein EDB81DRAFT_785551 [Dactylonectria macrodidyma]|uniref:Cyclin N-terminal domain-containing protein n=1 Tax=Dactylonectria macrodidyma TaxID=307937 RepID=A0A9P9FIQ7_9HYPO|nr:hypothetical protein EDB81DRAFT_785551 [Dactylonectria macrodidyma]
MNRQLAIRRDNFVDDLIGSTHRLLMALWPCPAAAPLGTPNLIPLRTYIERILRISGATYATLLAACYYLNLLHISLELNPVAVQSPRPAKMGPIQCPRRMFLSALMLGWKYTQEKSYSSKVWARISGLCLKEINSNEAMFLIVIDWRLYIPYEIFKR